MQEVAQRAGVAASSVSRVLSGHPNVSDVMRNRVLDAVAALGYEPDLLAQSLRRGATMTVGFRRRRHLQPPVYVRERPPGGRNADCARPDTRCCS